MDTQVRAPASRLARLSLRLADLIAAVALLSAVLGVAAALFGLDALGSGPGGLGGIPMMALTLCALAGLLLGFAGVVRSRVRADHWRALLIVVGPLLVAAARPLLHGIPAAALALLLRRAVRHGLT